MTQTFKQYLLEDRESWLEGTKVVDRDGKPQVVYHGTVADIKAFRPGSWFAATPQKAERYAKRRYRGADDQEDTPNLVPVYLRILNPLDFTGKISIDGATNLRWMAKKLGIARKADEETKMSDYWWNDMETHVIINSKVFKRFLEKAGYDGVKIREGGVVTWMVLSPKQVKSAVGSKFGDSDDITQ